MLNNKDIDFKFKKDLVKSTIQNCCGASYFSKNTELELLHEVSIREITSLNIVPPLMIIFGVKNFDQFSSEKLSKYFEMTKEELESSLMGDFFKNYLPIKMCPDQSSEKLHQVEETLLTKNQKEKERANEALQRFEEWKSKGRITFQ